MPLRAALVDVGGTIWPDRATVDPPAAATVVRLASVLPEVARDELETLRAALEEAVAAFSGELTQDTDGLVRRVAATLGHDLDGATVRAVRRAMNAPATDLVRLFDGTAEMLAGFRSLGLRTVIVSNAYWRDAAAYEADFTVLGIAGLLDGIVSSVDVRRRKPDPAMFHVAMEIAGCGAGECVMIGNVEEKDVLPALSLGMRAIRVAPDAERAPRSAAHASVTVLGDAEAVVRRWVAEG